MMSVGMTLEGLSNWQVAEIRACSAHARLGRKKQKIYR